MMHATAIRNFRKFSVLFLQYSIPASYVSGITSQAASTGLTPTTLANLEQTFIELQSVPTNLSSGQDPLTQSGFVPPIVDPAGSDRSSDRYDYSDMSDADWPPTGVKRGRGADGSDLTGYDMTTNVGGGRKRKRDEKVRSCIYRNRAGPLTSREGNLSFLWIFISLKNEFLDGIFFKGYRGRRSIIGV